MGIKDERKFENLNKLIQLLLDHPQGLHKADVARRLNIHRSTAAEYIDDLEKMGVPVYEPFEGLYSIDRDTYEVKISINLHESLALHLAARLLTTRTDKHYPHAASALRRLADAISGLAPLIANHMKQSANVLDGDHRRRDPIFIQALETLTRAWSRRRKVRLTHEMEDGSIHAYTFAPYFIEPYAAGRTAHVIGLRDGVDKIRTFKIERIRTIQLLEDAPYEIPETFDPRAQLKDAWGIWYAEGEPVSVKLKFTRKVAPRVRETIWHYNQKPLVELENGDVIWNANVADWHEMLPWVRGWGADVEVLKPNELRDALAREVKKMAKVYELGEIKQEDDLIAHRRERDGKEQLLITHLTEASQLAEGFAAKVNLPELGKIMGLLHDLGKASEIFQGYLRSKQGLISPDEDGYVEAQRGEVDHSTAGAQLVYSKLVSRGREGKFLAQFLALAIASHHSGLIDCLKPSGENEFNRRITKDDKDTHLTEAVSKLPDIEKQLDEILSQPIEQYFFKKIFEEMKEQNDSQSTLPFKHGLLARFLLSCLLEADRLNTADFENPSNEAVRNYGKYISWDTLLKRLEAKYAKYAQEMAKMSPGKALEVNQLRAQVAQACLEAAKKPKGIYQLTVPTGGGKTEASLRFALHHARAHKVDRVFYIVPYITIIDQNANKIREILEKADERDKVVLEHHSNLTPEQETRHHNLLAENWDAPLVFTTQVQFLEALFGSGTRDPRRMHQFANSVIILDEVQTVPIKIVHMLNAALRFLTHDCGSTVVLCTATQPPLDKLPENPYRALTIQPEQKIIQNEAELFEKLERVEVHDERKPGGLTNAEIADLTERALQEKGSVLVVVNTRASAQALYQQIKARNLGVGTYHLSTNMCPAHRVDVLNEVRAKLDAKEPVICVSTQLIEAGVDIDFGGVIRALTGLDSIAQSAGRCNRHGVRESLGSVWVVNLQEENLDRLTDIKVGRDHAQRILDDFRDNPEPFGDDRIGLNAIAAYYDFYYQSRENEMRYPVDANSSAGRNDDLFNLLSLNTLSTDAYKAIHHSAPEILLRQSFRSAAREFHVIDSPTRGVVVPYKKGEEIIKDLCGASVLEKQVKLLKRAQRYSVNLFAYQFETLFKAGAIKEVQTGAAIYHLDEQYYSEEFGWSDKPVGDMKVLIIGE